MTDNVTLMHCMVHVYTSIRILNHNFLSSVALPSNTVARCWCWTDDVIGTDALMVLLPATCRRLPPCCQNGGLSHNIE